MEEHPGAAVVPSYQIPTYVVGRHRLCVGVWRHLHPSERGLAARRSPADADVSAPAPRVPVAERPTVSLGVDPAYESAAASVDGTAPHPLPTGRARRFCSPRCRQPAYRAATTSRSACRRQHQPAAPALPAASTNAPAAATGSPASAAASSATCSPADSAMADTAPAAATSSPSTNCSTSLSSPELSDPAPPSSTRRSPRPDSFAPDVGRERLHRQIRDGARVSGSKPEWPLRTRSQVLEAALGP